MGFESGHLVPLRHSDRFQPWEVEVEDDLQLFLFEISFFCFGFPSLRATTGTQRIFAVVVGFVRAALKPSKDAINESSSTHIRRSDGSREVAEIDRRGRAKDLSISRAAFPACVLVSRCSCRCSDGDGEREQKKKTRFWIRARVSGYM